MQQIAEKKRIQVAAVWWHLKFVCYAIIVSTLLSTVMIVTSCVFCILILPA